MNFRGHPEAYTRSLLLMKNETVVQLNSRQRFGSVRPILLQSLIALLTALGLVACEPEAPRLTPTAALPQDPDIQVYMNHATTATYTEPYRQVTRAGDNFEQILIDHIAQARTSIDVAVQELRLPGIAAALVKQHQAGIPVRVILENTYSKPYSEYTVAEVAQLPEREQSRYQEARQLIDLNQDGQLGTEEIAQRDALVMLRAAQIPVIDDTADGSAGSGLMHHKFVIVDGQTLVTTSANFTTSDVHGDFKSQYSRGNANNLLVIRSPALAALFQEEFGLMWGDGPGGKLDSRFGTKKPTRSARSLTVGSSTVEVQFAPSSRAVPWVQSSNGLIGQQVKTAQRSLQMALFVFSDQTLVNSMEPLRQRGVEIQALIDSSFAYRAYSEGLDMLGVALADACKFEADNRPWQPAIATVGVPRLPPGDLLHHKFGVVDQRIVMTGSHNWTTAANTTNDETLLVIHNPTVAAHYDREFQRLYAQAILGVPPAIQKKVATSQQNCPTPARTAARSGSSAQPAQQLVPEAPTAQVQPDPTTAIAASPRPGRSPNPNAAPPKSPAPGARVNLNTATQAELETLPGIGPSLAKRIISERQKKPFRSLADLDAVAGIGPKLLKKLQNHVEW